MSTEQDILEQNLSEIIDRAVYSSIPECPECGHKVEQTETKIYCVNADCDKDEVLSI